MQTWTGNPRATQVFRFGTCAYDPRSGEATLSYFLDNGPELIERLSFPHAPWPPDPSRQAAFLRTLDVLHWIAGVSYYKAALPAHIQFDGRVPGPGLAEFLHQVYVQGLAEFSYVNQVDVAARFRFEAGPEIVPQAYALLLPERALVAMGGGKDSLVGLDLLRSAGMEVMPLCIGASSLIGNTVRAAGLPLLRIGRQLAPELEALNAAGAWNGHIPVTAINSAIALCASVLYGFRYVVFANERSADEATLVTADGISVNHQYSKSSAFEQGFRAVVRSYISPAIEYFSILRPFSELDIVRRFSSLTEYHLVYSSCNRNFHQQGLPVEGRWCRNCPKCRFAALSLAVFLDPPDVRAIQGGDLLDDPSQVDGFRALCGLGRDKPFECVGEAGESRAALAALAERPEWQHHLVVRALHAELQAVEVPGMASLLQPSARHNIPSSITSALPEVFT